MEVYIESSNSVKYTMNVQTPNQKLPIQAIRQTQSVWKMNTSFKQN